MDISYFCVFVAFLMCGLSKFPLVKAMIREPGGYDNHYPRDQENRLQGRGKRALGAHLNAFENFPPFAVAVIMGHLTGHQGIILTSFSVLFVLSRLVYHYLYLQDRAMWRSLVYGLGYFATTALFVQAIFF